MINDKEFSSETVTHEQRPVIVVFRSVADHWLMYVIIYGCMHTCEPMKACILLGRARVRIPNAPLWRFSICYRLCVPTADSEESDVEESYEGCY